MTVIRTTFFSVLVQSTVHNRGRRRAKPQPRRDRTTPRRTRRRTQADSIATPQENLHAETRCCAPQVRRGKPVTAKKGHRGEGRPILVRLSRVGSGIPEHPDWQSGLDISHARIHTFPTCKFHRRLRRDEIGGFRESRAHLE